MSDFSMVGRDECLRFRAQLDELQKKQDQLNSFKNSKLCSNTGVHSTREAYGESPTKRSLPTVKSSRSLSLNRPHIKRLTAVTISFDFDKDVHRFI